MQYFLGSVEHRAQVILYSLMMMERYDNTLDTGLLLYLKTGHMLGVPAYMHEKRALVMKRNELIQYLSHTGARLSQNMPGKMVRILEETKNLHVAASLLQACGLAIDLMLIDVILWSRD